jgi:hypothetical protein
MATESPGVWNSIIYKKATYRRTVEIFEDDGVTPLDLTGYSFRFYAATKVNGTVLFDFDSSDILDATHIIVNNLAGTVELVLTPTETNSIDATSVIVSLDVTQPDGDILPFLQGKFSVKERAASA